MKFSGPDDDDPVEAVIADASKKREKRRHKIARTRIISIRRIKIKSTLIFKSDLGVRGLER